MMIGTSTFSWFNRWQPNIMSYFWNSVWSWWNLDCDWSLSTVNSFSLFSASALSILSRSKSFSSVSF